MATSPTLKVEIAFTSDPLDTTPTWVDVSQYVRRSPGVNVIRGKQERAESFDAGYLQLTLSNRDRRFDPSYAAGPHFGNLTPRKQIRVTGTWAAVDYPMFTGWVTGWPQGSGDNGKDATVTIEAVSAEARLANNNLPNDLVYDYADTTLGSLAFFLRQADTSSWSDATDSGYFATPTVGSGRTTGSLMPAMASTAVSFDGNTVWSLNKHYASVGAWSLSFWMQTTSTAGYLFGGSTSGGFPSGTVLLTTNAQIEVNLADAVISNGPIFLSSLATPLNNGIPHHIVITSDGSTIPGYHIYVDGADSTTGLTGTVAVPLVLDWIGSPNSAILAAYNGSLQDVAVFDQQLTALEVESLYNLSRGFWQESSADRVTRLLDDVGWPAAWRDITTNPRASVGELVYNGAPVLSKLQEVERSEQGMLFATKDGKIAFRERYYANEVTVGSTVQQIFSDDGGATALPYSTFEFQFNDPDVTNDVTVTTPNTWAASSDAASIAANDRQSRQVDTILADFDAANAMAAGLVAAGKDAKYRAAPVLVYPVRNTTRWDEVLGLELGYRLSMEITPMQVGSQNAQEVTLERIEWLIEADLWSLIVAGSPCFGGASGATPGWFIIGQSLIGGPDVIGF